MHLSATRGLAALYRGNASGSPAHERARALLEAVIKGEMLIWSTTTERGTDNLYPMTQTHKAENGWRIQGAKI